MVHIHQLHCVISQTREIFKQTIFTSSVSYVCHGQRKSPQRRYVPKYNMVTVPSSWTQLRYISWPTNDPEHLYRTAFKMLNLCKHANNLSTATHTHSITHSLTPGFRFTKSNDTRAAFGLMEPGKPGVLVHAPGTRSPFQINFVVWQSFLQSSGCAYD